MKRKSRFVKRGKIRNRGKKEKKELKKWNEKVYHYEWNKFNEVGMKTKD